MGANDPNALKLKKKTRGVVGASSPSRRPGDPRHYRSAAPLMNDRLAGDGLEVTNEGKLAVTADSGGELTGAAGGDLTGNYPDPTLAAIVGAAGPIGSAAVVPIITIDAKGRVTALSSAAIGGGPPTGAAGGDLTGTYPNPTLVAIGAGAGPIGSATAVPIVTIDTKGRVTALTSTTIAGVAPGGAAGGDLTGTYPNPTLAAIVGAAGPIGNATTVPVVTIDAKGRVTALGSATITGVVPGGAAGGDLTGSYPNPTLAAIVGAAGPIGGATTVPIVTIDAKGRVTALSSTTITGVVPGGSASGDLTGTYPGPTLAAIGAATGPIGASTTIPVVTIDAKGRVTALTSVALASVLDSNARVTVRTNSGADTGTRRRINFINGTNVTVSASDDAGGEEVDVTINASGGGGSATTVEVDLGATPKFAGKFTITDAAIGATSKVLCWQAPGPYTGKGSRADEAEMQPVQVIAVEPATGTAVVKWNTPICLVETTILTLSKSLGSGIATNNGTDRDRGSVAYRKGLVKGNVKFSYMVLA